MIKLYISHVRLILLPILSDVVQPTVVVTVGWIAIFFLASPFFSFVFVLQVWYFIGLLRGLVIFTCHTIHSKVIKLKMEHHNEKDASYHVHYSCRIDSCWAQAHAEIELITTTNLNWQNHFYRTRRWPRFRCERTPYDFMQI